MLKNQVVKTSGENFFSEMKNVGFFMCEKCHS